MRPLRTLAVARTPYVLERNGVPAFTHVAVTPLICIYWKWWCTLNTWCLHTFQASYYNSRESFSPRVHPNNDNTGFLEMSVSIVTSHGTFMVELFWRECPRFVISFASSFSLDLSKYWNRPRQPSSDIRTACCWEQQRTAADGTCLLYSYFPIPFFFKFECNESNLHSFTRMILLRIRICANIFHPSFAPPKAACQTAKR